MIDVNLATVDWAAVSTEAFHLDGMFKKDELAACVGSEISFEDGLLTTIAAGFKRFIASMIQFISDKGKQLSEYLQTKRYKTMGDRVKAFNQYMAVKVSKTATYNVGETFYKLYSIDEDFKKATDSAIANLNNYLAEPYESVTDFVHEFSHNQPPMAIALQISSRAKTDKVPTPDKLLEIIDAVNKLTADTSSYTWDNFVIGDAKFANVDNLRFTLGNHALFNDSLEEFEATAALLRELMSGKNYTVLEQSAGIYDITKNTQYITRLTPVLPKCIKAISNSVSILKKLDANYQRDFMSGDRGDDADRRLLARVRAAVSMFGAISGYLNNITAMINRIDGFNSAIMTAQKYLNSDYLRKHTLSRGALGNGTSVLDTQAYSLIMRNDGVLEMALEDLGLHDVKADMESYSNNYVNAMAIESRVMAYGACIKDAAALEAMSPGCFKNEQISDLFDFRPSMRNAEIALEVSGIIKSALIAVLVSLIVKYVNRLIEYIEVKLSSARKARVEKTMNEFRRAQTVKVNSQATYREQNQNIMAGLQKQRNIDKTGKTNPTGQSHNSAIKPKVINNAGHDVDITSRRSLYKNVLVPMLGIAENNGAGLENCTDVRDFLRFLQSTGVQGPAIFSNDPINNVQKLVLLTDNAIVNTHQIARSMDKVKQQLDAFITGSRNEPYFITEANDVFQNYLGEHGITDTAQLAKEMRAKLAVERRKVPLANSPLFRDPKVIEDCVSKIMVFKDEQAIRNLNKFTAEIKSLSQSAQASLDKFTRVETDPARKAEVERAVKKYINDLRELSEAIGGMIQLISTAFNYLETVANAVNTFIKG